MSRNVPKLRFKGFEDEWENYKLGSFSEKITEKNKGFKVKNVISNSAKNGLISQRDFFEKDIANKNNIDGYYIIKNGDFVYNPRKSNEAPYGPINKYKFKDDGVVSPLYFCFRINNKVSNEYLEEYFKSSKWYRYVHMNSDQGARHDRVSIKDSEVMNMKIKLPSLQEQEKIANFLSKVDSIIEKQEKKVQYWNSYKKGMMQKIFSQKIRFKDENGRNYPEWEENKLEDYIMEYTEKTVIDNQYPVLTSSRKGLMLQSEYFKDRQVTTDSNIGYFVIPRGYITFRSRSDDGIFVFNQNNIIDKGIISYFYPVFNFNESINKYYALIYMNNYLKKEIFKEVVGTSQLVLSMSKLKKLKIKFPCLDEQIKIANFLSNIDNIIEKESNKLEELRQWKKGLLQQMFV